MPFPRWAHKVLPKRYQPYKEDFEARAAELDRYVLESASATSSVCLDNSTNKSLLDHSIAAFSLLRRQEEDSSDGVPLPPLPVFVPPPKTDVTPSLIEQSLTVQPQRNAIVHSVIPYFADGIIIFHVQLDGPIPQTLLLNATNTVPCDRIGTQPDPNLILVPRNVYHGHQDITIPDCLIIAINKYNASWINYWVQKTDGSGAIFSLLGDAKVHDIDQLDTSKSAALQIRVASATNTVQKVAIPTPAAPVTKRHNVPRAQMHSNADVMPRGLEGLNPYTAIMSAEACSAIKCINNNNNAALFNPFTKTCWCSAPVYIDINPSAHGSA